MTKQNNRKRPSVSQNRAPQNFLEIEDIKRMAFERKQIEKQQHLMEVAGWSVPMPDKIEIGTDGEIIDENRYSSPEIQAEIVNRYNIHDELISFIADYAYNHDDAGGDYEKVCAAIDLIVKAGP